MDLSQKIKDLDKKMKLLKTLSKVSKKCNYITVKNEDFSNMLVIGLKFYNITFEECNFANTLFLDCYFENSSITKNSNDRSTTEYYGCRLIKSRLGVEL